jgi:addiction module RelE/StbE family toxin
MIIVYHRDFRKSYRKLPQRLKEKLEERLRLFSSDEFHPILNNHALKGKYLGYRSINITGDMRAIFKRDSNSTLFVTIDSHSNLYG